MTRPMVVTMGGRDTDWLAEFPSEATLPVAAETPVDDAFDLFPAELPAETPAPRVMNAVAAVERPAALPQQSGTLASTVRATFARFVWGA